MYVLWPHWHGFFQPNNSWADSVAMVTQCPIATNRFLYTFPTAGTFWYHSHLLVYDPHDPHASLYVITLQDWSINLFSSGILVSTLINGLGLSLPLPPASKLAAISVTSGKRYRMRLVSMSCDPNFIFTIDGHIMTIIEADGVNTEPLTVDSIQIYTGQRYSFILTPNKKVDNYWICTIANGGATNFKPGWAILRYMGANHTDPTTSTAPLLETDLHPFEKTAVPGKPVAGGADITMNLVISFNNASNRPLLRSTILFPQILSGTRSARDLLPLGSVFTLPPNSVVDLSIPGGSPGASHPFHLHGHTFFVIRSAGSDTYNFHNPVPTKQPFGVCCQSATFPSSSSDLLFSFVTEDAGP
ncbi:multicopper oxidase-domain-containing protein [Mycena olivaceomarginata]|nr:multicopper oxidase-domain-containing protein [Mycena olivaceomarginata]